MASKGSKIKVIDRYNAGVAFYNKKDYSGAITEFNATVAVEPKNERFIAALANAYNNRGVQKYERKMYPSALLDFAKAAKLMPQSGQFAQNYNMAQDAAQKYELDKLCAGAYDAYNKKNYADAIKLLKEAAEKDVKNRELIKSLAIAYNGRGIENYEKGRFAHAAEDFAKAKQLWPDEKQYELNLEWTKAAAKRKGKK